MYECESEREREQKIELDWIGCWIRNIYSKYAREGNDKNTVMMTMEKCHENIQYPEESENTTTCKRTEELPSLLAFIPSVSMNPDGKEILDVFLMSCWGLFFFSSDSKPICSSSIELMKGDLIFYIRKTCDRYFLLRQSTHSWV